MIRTYLSNDYVKRTIRPLYSWTQATPKSCFLDPAWTRAVPIWPGMGFVRTGGDLVTLAGAGAGQMGGKTMTGTGTGSPAGVTGTGSLTPNSVPVYGLGALYVGGDGIDELLYAGINAFAVWVLGPDAEFEILAPAFDATATWTDPTDGSGAALVAVSTSGSNQGMLIPVTGAGSATATAPVAKLLKVNSSTKITIGGLSPYAAAELTANTNAGRN
jgi:hypothetical protein